MNVKKPARKSALVKVQDTSYLVLHFDALPRRLRNALYQRYEGYTILVGALMMFGAFVIVSIGGYLLYGPDDLVQPWNKSITATLVVASIALVIVGARLTLTKYLHLKLLDSDKASFLFWLYRIIPDSDRIYQAIMTKTLYDALFGTFDPKGTRALLAKFLDRANNLLDELDDNYNEERIELSVGVTADGERIIETMRKLGYEFRTQNQLMMLFGEYIPELSTMLNVNLRLAHAKKRAELLVDFDENIVAIRQTVTTAKSRFDK